MSYSTMTSLPVRVVVVAVVAAVVAMAEPSYPYKHYCQPTTVTVTKVDTVVKEVPVYRTVVQLKQKTVTKTTTSTIKIIHTAHPVHHTYTTTYAYGR